MTYTFKLSRRLARLRGAAVLAASIVTLSCAADDTSGPGLNPSDARANSLTLSPNAITVGVNQTVKFEAVADSSAGLWTALSWTATGGTVDTSGEYTAGKESGKFRVIASRWNRGIQANGPLVWGMAVVTITTISQIVLSPANVSLRAGGTQQFTVEGQSSHRASVWVTPRYTATGGTISSAGVYTAGETPGTFQVIATDTVAAKADTAAVTITPPSSTLEAVVLTPASIELQTGTSQQFAATGRMSDGSTTTVNVAYIATGGTMTSGGSYTAGSVAGSYRVIAKLAGGTLADTSAVTITPPSPAPPGSTLEAVVLTPASIELQTGATQQFAAIGRMSDGSTTTVNVTYSATGGTTTSDGLYTAGTSAGVFQVIATQQGGPKADTSTVRITVSAPTLTQLVLTPASITLAPAGTSQFAVTGTWSDGTSTVPAVTYSATGGSSTAGGLYTAGATPGAFRVIATHQGGTVADTATVTIAVPPPPQGVRYVSTSGNDANPGTQAAPFRTIQKCLNVIQPGETCMIAAGAYNESLTLITSGTVSLPIRLTCQPVGACTVNSGAAQTLGTSNHTHYYTIDGLRFIGTAVTSQATLYFGQGTVWSPTDETLGNNGFILRNCYIEGNVRFYGHNNLVENCELNGKGIWSDGLIDGYATSHHNTYRNNLIHHYTFRGIWTMQQTDHIWIEDNTVHHVAHGIDTDGAGVPVTYITVLNNHVYNAGLTEWGAGIYLENCFDCLVQGNTVHDIGNLAPGLAFQNYGNGSAEGWHTAGNIEYRDDASRTRVLNNVVHTYSGGGVWVSAVRGLTFDHNTFYDLSSDLSIDFRAETDDFGTVFMPINETITNNIFRRGAVRWVGGTTTGLVESGNFSGNPSFVNPPTDLHLQTGSPACSAGAFPCAP
jgi:parallel beta helix pectate lyase-like protein